MSQTSTLATPGCRCAARLHKLDPPWIKAREGGQQATPRLVAHSVRNVLSSADPVPPGTAGISSPNCRQDTADVHR